MSLFRSSVLFSWALLSRCCGVTNGRRTRLFYISLLFSSLISFSFSRHTIKKRSGTVHLRGKSARASKVGKKEPASRRGEKSKLIMPLIVWSSKKRKTETQRRRHRRQPDKSQWDVHGSVGFFLPNHRGSLSSHHPPIICDERAPEIDRFETIFDYQYRRCARFTQVKKWPFRFDRAKQQQQQKAKKNCLSKHQISSIFAFAYLQSTSSSSLLNFSTTIFVPCHLRCTVFFFLLSSSTQNGFWKQQANSIGQAWSLNRMTMSTVLRLHTKRIVHENFVTATSSRPISSPATKKRFTRDQQNYLLSYWQAWIGCNVLSTT